MDDGLKIVTDCVQRWQPKAELDEPILHYIQQLAEQAAQDSDLTELREGLTTYIFPDAPLADVDPAIDYLLFRFRKGQIPDAVHQKLTSISPHEATSNAPESAPYMLHELPTQAGAVLLSSRGGSNSAGLPHGNADAAKGTPFPKAAFGSLRLNPNASVFIPRQASSPESAPPAVVILPPDVLGSVIHDYHSHHNRQVDDEQGGTRVTGGSDSGGQETFGERDSSLGAPNPAKVMGKTLEGGKQVCDFNHGECTDTGAGAVDWEASDWDLTPQEAEEQFLEDAGAAWEGASEVTGDQALAILSYWFPSYSISVLGDVLAANGGSLAAAYAELSTLELDMTTIHDTSFSPTLSSLTPGQLGTQAKPATPLVVLDESNFPSLLGSSLPSSSNSNPTRARRDQEGGSPAGAPLSFASALQSGAARSPLPAAPGFSSSRSSQPWSQPPPAAGKAAGASVPWVATGDAVAAQYAAARAEARDHARLRNMCFQQATLAYLSGSKALAKELSRRGRHHSDLMKECHARASRSIFIARNSHLNAPERGPATPGTGAAARSGPANFVDLHGIHASEAGAMLEQFLVGWRRGRQGANGQQSMLVCVGTGHHTKVSQARLPQAVESYLKHEGLSYSYAQPGLIRIVL